jgi:hypothetical protein
MNEFAVEGGAIVRPQFAHGSHVFVGSWASSFERDPNRIEFFFKPAHANT